MRRNLMGALGVGAMLAALAGPAMAQETQTVWKTDGKRWTRTEEMVKPFAMPTTQRIEVAEKQEGDILGFKYVGKRMEPVYFREVPLANEMAKGHECTWKMVYEKKQMNKVHFCLDNGVAKTCPGMNAAGECLGKK